MNHDDLKQIYVNDIKIQISTRCSSQYNLLLKGNVAFAHIKLECIASV